MTGSLPTTGDVQIPLRLNMAGASTKLMPIWPDETLDGAARAVLVPRGSASPAAAELCSALLASSDAKDLPCATSTPAFV